MYNVLSLLLGLVALGLPLYTVLRPSSDRRALRAAVGSGSAGLLALLCQLLEVGRRIAVQDYAGLEDIWGAMLLAGVVLVLLTVLLNGVLLHSRRHPADGKMPEEVSP
ncbi:MAG: hypothetical protein LIO45_09105 [Clostridiales bacterium]|nr:hypothetical protein [Clostridiales bacterium]